MVWLRVLRAGDVESAARREARRVNDQRAINFFDPNSKLATLYSEILQFPRGFPAWDVYFVFGPELRWDNKPPPPTYWMHQLGRAAPPGLRLDGEKLAQVVNSLLAGIQAKGVATANSIYEYAVGPLNRRSHATKGVPWPPTTHPSRLTVH